MTATRPKTATDPDGAAVQIFPLPTDEASLEQLLRDLFEQHWDKITFGPLIQGGRLGDPCAARTDPCRHAGRLPHGGLRHFAFPPLHRFAQGAAERSCARGAPRHRRTARAELYRRLDRSGVPASWGLRMFNGAGEQQLTILLPTRSSLPKEISLCRSRTGRGWHCGMNCGRDGPGRPDLIRSTDRACGSHTEFL